MWIGTEAGLVRFDGTNFRTFTTQDGLPDNEVLGLIFDSVTSRLWIITYSKFPCYYRGGRFYTTANDSSLRKITCEYGEFISGDLQQGLGVFLNNGTLLYRCVHDSITKIQTTTADMRCVHQWNDSVIDIMVGVRGIVRYENGTDTPLPLFCCDTTQGRGTWIGTKCIIFRRGRIDLYQYHQDVSYQYIGDIKYSGDQKAVSILSSNGSYIFSVFNDGVYVVDTLLRNSPQKIWSGKCNGISIDNRNSLWISTSDDGLYILRNNYVFNYNADNGLIHDNITALCGYGSGQLYFGNSNGELYRYDHQSIAPVKGLDGFGQDKVRAITTFDDFVFLITSSTTAYLHPGGGGVIIPHWGDRINATRKHWGGGPKSILKLRDGKTIYVGLLACIGTFDISRRYYDEVVLNKRIITMAEHPDGKVFCGSLDGIYQFERDSLVQVGRDNPDLARRVTSICFSADSLLWIGTPSDGILVYDGQRILSHINSRKYLGYHGAICRKIVTGRNHEIWVATNDGINKIRYSYGDSFAVENITPLNMTDGLTSDDVNDILVQDSMVYVATSHGLSVLNENQISNLGQIPIYISSVRINDKENGNHEGEYLLDYTQNNLKIEYVAVALTSGGNLRYQYRLLGSGSDKWTTTSNTSIEFRSLSAGTYVFEAIVLDKFGNKSASVARVRFRISPAFYLTIWFWALTMVVILAAGFYIIRRRFRGQQLQFEKEQGLNNKIIELEQQALKAQMNPHFIFNCLTAIQHFVNREDLYSANMYLSNFAKLIRKTLDLSGEQYVPLDKEVSYLENYIQLEKLRFQEKFQYTITVSPDIDEYAVSLPPMLLQPIIENAIRHGLRNMEGDTGVLSVTFDNDGGKLICTIDDNGIGRKKAEELKTTTHVEYQSKGMSLTMSRIQAINMISDKKITIEIKDKYNDTNESDGTLFILTFEQ